jgi:elongation of very long chain fatty acids protein 4
VPEVRGLYGYKFAYNLIQVMLCSYMWIEAAVQAYNSNYQLKQCNAFNHTNPPIGFILYVFYLSKILDFFDTFFIIAEKRWKQLTFLHVYHHFSIFLVFYCLLLYIYVFYIFFLFIINFFNIPFFSNFV